MSLKTKIKKIIPGFLISLYHLMLAALAAAYYGFPSKKMVVIGVTGTKGKTSAANFIWSVLNAADCKVGLMGTANIRIGDVEMLNKYHMTMPGRFILQGLLKKMVDADCEYCVVETTSEGIKQWRHWGIFYDIAVFTNLTPEHLQAHGGDFQKYKEAKGRMFRALKNGKRKIINDPFAQAGREIKKTIIANYDDLHKEYFLAFPADKKITFGVTERADFQADKIRNTLDGLEFFVGAEPYEINILGKFNIYNALPAVVIGRELGISTKKIQSGLKNLSVIPGRMERINEGQNFAVFVDYAHEKEGMTAVLDTAREIASENNSKVIVLLGAEGGGRDKAKRPILGEIVAKNADFVVVSNVDPYEDDPKEICEDIAVSSEKFGKSRGKDLFVIENRQEGIKKALSLATKNDVVLITGKGAEQSIIIGGKRYPWDDRVVVREELNKLL